MTLRKTALSAIVLAAVVSSSFNTVLAQTATAGTSGSSASKTAKPKFQGTLSINAMFQENPFTKEGEKRAYVDGGHVNFRLTITDDKLALDSFSEGMDRAGRFRLVYDRNSKVLTSIKQRWDYSEEDVPQENRQRVEMAEMTDFKKLPTAEQVEANLSESRKKKLADSSLTMQYSVTDFQMVINGTHCRRITGENKTARVDFWVSDKIGLKLTDFTDIAQLALGGDKELLMMSRHAGKVPAELINSFPMRVVIRPKNERRRNENEKEAVIMFQVKAWSNTVDPAAFSLSNVRVRPQRNYEEDYNTATETMVDSAAAPAPEPAPAPAQKKTVKSSQKKKPAQPAQKVSPAATRRK